MGRARHSERAWSAVEAAADGIIITDRAGRIQHLNPAAQRLTGWRQEAAAGQELSCVLRLDENGAAVGQDLVGKVLLQSRAIALGEGWTLRGRDVEGEIAVTETGGAVSGTVITFRDVTLSKRRREAEERNLRLRATARLAGGVAHEFNDLLTVILGCADHLRSALGEDPALRSAIEQLGKATGAAAEVAQELLSVARAEAAFPGPLNLSELIAAFCPELRRTMPANVAIKTSLDGCVVTIRADAGQMRLMIANAALHARRWMPEGGTIRIESANVEIGLRKFVRIRVVDSRVPRNVPRLPVQRLKGTELLILESIVQDAGGSLKVESAPRSGAALEMLFPAEESAGPAPCAAEADAGGYRAL